jgi:hypothetical protein
LIGKAVTLDEQKRLFDAARSTPEWEHVYCAAVVAANSSLRPIEVKHLRRMDVDRVLESISGHLSKRMLDHYSHIRLQAKREALEALDAQRAAAPSNADRSAKANGAIQ